MKEEQLRYSVLDRPPWAECILLGFQNYLTMLGSTVLIPFTLALNATVARTVIGTIFFVSGVVTLVQTCFGDRLPIIQGGSFAYLTPAFAIIAQVKARGAWVDSADGTNHARFLVTMRELQGGIIASSLFIIFLGISGLLTAILRFITPITVAVNIAIVGLSLYGSGFSGVGNCMQLGLPMIAAIVIFSQYLRKYSLPIPYVGRISCFELFPVKYCRTDQESVLHTSPWFRFPYPLQWGAPTFAWSSTLTMLAGALSALVESLGDWYAAARICGAPVPPPAVISRATTVQGVCCLLVGLWGSGNGSTAHNENIGAMQITRVGSRLVIQVGAVIIMVFALIGKFGGLFASMPQAIVSGLFCVMFGIIAAVGISQLQFTDNNSPRNSFIVGVGLYLGLSIPDCFAKYTAANGHGPVNTGSQGFNDIANSIFNTAAAVSLIVTLFLDNTIPGSEEERGLHVWLMQATQDWLEDEALQQVYGLPFGISRTLGRWWRPHRDRATRCCIALAPRWSPKRAAHANPHPAFQDGV
ncbi:hypothetical protein WJX81_006828 [Elliptochloris bilobata]|uniref:Uncharacterized protein n=1 Tax=Elliptochloris bilobata TaxID=381761 RepID=A0AAW1RNS0_9CHLO